ncbi:MAG: TerB family tellurite resistance protein [Bacteroidia bacterium]
MTSLESLHYAMGELAYCMARIDGVVQKEERQKFFEIVKAELDVHHSDFDISKIIFQIMEKDKMSAETTYEWAMKEIKLNSHYLSPELKQSYITIMEKIAEAYPPVTPEESNILERFKKDIEPLHGDPIFYEKKELI